MKERILCFLALILLNYKFVVAQTITYPDEKDTTVFNIKEYYKGFGRILTVQDRMLDDTDDFYQISIREVLLAEAILINSYRKVIEEDPRTNKTLVVNEVRMNLNNYYRFYEGFKDSKGDICVFIALFNFAHYKAQAYFSCWRTKDITGINIDNSIHKEDPMGVDNSMYSFFIVNITKSILILP